MRTALAIAVLAASAVCFTAGAQGPRVYRYEFQLDPGGKKHDRVIHGTAQVSGTRARIDTDEDKPEDERGYFLVTDGGRTVTVVHPGRKTYETHDADEFAHIVGTAMRAAGPVLKVTVRDARLDTARLGAGERIAGHPTQRVQLRQRWTTSMRVLGFVKEDMGGSSVAEYWADPSMPLMRNPLLDIVSTSLLALASSDNDFIEHSDAARAALFRGSPLRADVRMTTTGSDGDDITRLRYEVTSITLGGVNEADLEIPKGFKRSAEKTIKL